MTGSGTDSGTGTIGGLGEFGLIARVAARVQAPPSPAGPGDDAAVVPAPDGRVVATTDLLVEGVHFRRDWSSGYDVGVKAAAQNLADVAAMGAAGTALLVGLAAPADLPVEVADALADGLRDEAARAGAVVVGGDVVRAPTLMIAITALGDLRGLPPVTRAGARVGDLVVLAGRCGCAAAGLALLERGLLDGPLQDAHRRPAPDYAAGPALAALGATAMVDTSDGLVQDLGHVAAASGVRVELSGAALRPGRGVTLADVLHGGEDHALVATVPPHVTTPYPVVGRVAAGDGVWLDGGRVRPAGWDHYR